MNYKPLKAYESMDLDIKNKLLPGFSNPKLRLNFKRFIKDPSV